MIELKGQAVPAPSTRVASLRSLLIGAGEAGRGIAPALRRVPEYGLTPIGFLDDNPVRRQVAGLPVLGSISDMAEVAVANDVDVALVTIPSLAPHRITAIAARAHSVGLMVRFLR